MLVINALPVASRSAAVAVDGTELADALLVPSVSDVPSSVSRCAAVLPVATAESVFD